jgi:flagellin FlaB
MRYHHHAWWRAARAERGITGLETAIVLTAFVIVSSVFAFAALSVGLFSTDRARDTITAGLLQTRGAMELRGAVIAEDTDENGYVDKIILQVANSAGGAAVNLTPGVALVRYWDEDQNVTLGAGNFSALGQGNADNDNLLEVGETFQITLTGLEALLDPDLGIRTSFVVQIMPPGAPVLYLERSTPVALSKFNDLN